MIPHALVEPGFLASPAVHVAAAVGGAMALVCGVVGVFTVLRSQAFAGHAMGEIASAGGSGAFLAGVSPLAGFVGAGVVAAAAMEMIGIRRARGRDLATGIVLGTGLGLAALFLYYDTTVHSTTGATVTVLFGSMFAIAGSTVPVVAVLGAATLAAVAWLYRPLLLSSLSPELAAVRGVRVRLVGVLYLATLAVAVALSALTVGSILSTALLIGPAAAATRVTRRPGTAMAVAAGGGLAVTWLGILLAYDSYYWPPAGTGWPVSFFIVTLVLVLYLVASRIGAGRRREGG